MRELGTLLRRGDVRGLADRYGDVALAGLIVAIVAMMVVPMPTWTLDLLITGNITVAVVVLLVAIYLQDALRFAAFPTLLLITTLYRLALNVSSTRLILLQADAGRVIQSFGEFVVQGNFVVGAVIFLILTIIQYVVIAKGAERVAEVAARFTLDAMPGKQMAIDAELRAGAYDHDEATQRRAQLQREAQLYGSMDGAMKFVKGDAIAGMLITVINIVGGLIIGVGMRELALAEAAQLYTILTIGDGLVSQIPALLISSAAGIIVTRVASEDEEAHLGRDLGRQLLQHPRALSIAAVLLAALAFVGLPRLPFLLLAALTGAVALALRWQRRRQVVPRVEPPAIGAGVVPVALEVSEELTPVIEADREDGRLVRDDLPALREAFFTETGVAVPGVRVRGFVTDLPPGGYRIKLHGVPIGDGQVPPGAVVALADATRLAALGVEPHATATRDAGGPSAWVAMSAARTLADAGIETRGPAAGVLLHLRAALRRHLHELVGIQETQQLLDQLEETHPALVRELTPKLCSTPLVAEVLRRLVEEGISIRDRRGIIQALAEHAGVEKDPVALTEQVRIALRRYISYQHTGGSGTLAAFVIDAPIEEAVRGAVQHTGSGSYLALEPEVSREILDAVAHALGRAPAGHEPPVILTQSEVRRYFKRLLEVDYPEATVLSYQELTPDLTIEPVGRIRLSGDA